MSKRVAIIGSGLSGAICYKALNGLIDKVQVFEQNNQTGGRLRLHNTICSTPSFTVSTPFFQNIVERWIDAGWVIQRQAWDVEISNNEILNSSTGTIQFQATENLLSIVNELLNSKDVCSQTTVFEIDRVNNLWRLFDKDSNYLGAFDCVIHTQANSSSQILMKASQRVSDALDSVVYSSIWTALICFNEEIDFPYDSASFDRGSLAKVYKLKHNKKNYYYLMATPEWSENYKNKSKNDIVKMLSLALFGALQQAPVDIQEAIVNFWKHKSPIQAYGQDCVFDEQLGLGACGDWCVAPRIEGAVLSGFSVADRVMKFFS